jgi:excinuclease UvrABC helicase subunit UvrB
MLKKFDDLFNDFFNRKKTSNQVNEGINRIISALQNFRQMGFEENIGNSIEKELGPPNEVEEIVKDGFLYKRHIWNTEHGQFVKVTVQLADQNINDLKQEKTLEEQLQDAVESENYELAIQLRDKIKNLKTTTNENNSKRRRNTKSKQ